MTTTYEAKQDNVGALVPLQNRRRCVVVKYRDGKFAYMCVLHHEGSGSTGGVPERQPHARPLHPGGGLTMTLARDSQRGKVYAWERVALPGFTTRNRLATDEVRALIARVQGDVEAAGGFVNRQAAVKFTKRTGGACASWRVLNFTPGRTSHELVLHELAHHLTYDTCGQIVAEKTAREGGELDAFQQHALRHFDGQGHGPRYVACYVALLEHYAGKDVGTLLRACRSFTMETWGPWHVVRGTPTGGAYKSRSRITKTVTVKVDVYALAYWRRLLAPATMAMAA